MRREVVRSPVELRGLGAQQMRQRLVGQRLARLAGVAGGQRAVAGADGDDAAGQRIEAALLPAPVQDSGRRRPGSTRFAAAATSTRQQPDQQRQDDEGAEHAGFGDVVLPFDDDGARPVGQPVQARGDDKDAEQERDETDHRLGSTAPAVAGRAMT